MMRRGPAGREGVAENPVEPALCRACYRKRRVLDQQLAGLRHRHLSHDPLRSRPSQPIDTRRDVDPTLLGFSALTMMAFGLRRRHGNQWGVATRHPQGSRRLVLQSSPRYLDSCFTVDNLRLARSVVELEALGLESGRKHPGKTDGLQRITSATSCCASLAPARQFTECRIQRSPITDDVSPSIVLKADECLSRLGDGGVHQKGSPVSGRDQAQSPRFIISRRRASWKRLVWFCATEKQSRSLTWRSPRFQSSTICLVIDRRGVKADRKSTRPVQARPCGDRSLGLRRRGTRPRSRSRGAGSGTRLRPGSRGKAVRPCRCRLPPRVRDRW